jgi:LmbE family N-acetylglucosaminyl deacetylase
MQDNKMSVLAMGCHPDDIEFMMAGTLLLAGRSGARLHYFNLADGCLGSNLIDIEHITAKRADEARQAAAYAKAEFHPSMAHDLHVFYEDGLLRRVAALVREVDPDILLLPALADYMEDHMNTARLGVTAAFAKGMSLYETVPPRSPSTKPVALYHAMPYGLADALGKSVEADLYVDITAVMEDKRRMLGFHESQRAWLDATQKVDAYVEAMAGMARTMGSRSSCFAYAEGWVRHNPLGFSEPDYDPLRALLGQALHPCGGL